MILKNKIMSENLRYQILRLILSYNKSRHYIIGVNLSKQINDIEYSTKIDPHIYGQLILEKDGKEIQWKKIVSPVNK